MKNLYSNWFCINCNLFAINIVDRIMEMKIIITIVLFMYLSRSTSKL